MAAAEHKYNIGALNDLLDRIGLVTSSPAANTVLDRLKDIVDGIAAAVTVVDGGDVAQGATDDAAITAGNEGTISAKLRSISRDLIANIVLATGANAIGTLAANSGVDIGDVNAPVLETLASSVETTPTQITKTVAAVATPEALAAAGTCFRSATLEGKKAARTDNAGIVYLGIGAGNDTQPVPINPGEEITITAPPGEKYDLNDWYCDVLNAGDGVVVIYS